MGIEEHVRDSRPALKKRPGYALAATMALILLMTVVLGVAVSHLDYSSDVTEAWRTRVKARNNLESMVNLAFKWLSAKVNDGARPRAQAAIDLENLTDYNSLRIFASNGNSYGYDGCEVSIYDLGYDAGKITKPVDAARMFPPSFPGGYMIRASVEKEGFAPLTLENVYMVTLNIIEGETAVEILDGKPVYSRELFRK